MLDDDGEETAKTATLNRVKGDRSYVYIQQNRSSALFGGYAGR